MLAVGEFRGHVQGRPDHAGESGQGRAVGQPGHTEVGEAGLWVVRVGDIDEHVCGFEVTVNDAGCVYDGQCTQHMADQPDRRRCRQHSSFSQIHPQVHAVDEVHDDREGVSFDDEIADGDEMRIVEAEQHRPFLHESGDHFRVVGEFTAQHLHGYRTVAVHGRPTPDLAERTPSDRFVQHIAGTQFPHSMSPFPRRNFSYFIISGGP